MKKIKFDSNVTLKESQPSTSATLSVPNRYQFYADSFDRNLDLTDEDDAYDNHDNSSMSSDGDCRIFNNKTDNKFNINESLRNWAVEENVNSNTINSLLKILKLHFEQLPLDYRSLLKTPRTSNFISLKNGSMFYFGLEANLNDILDQHYYVELESIKLQVNIDGLPLFKSSTIEFWPILGVCRALVLKPFAIAIFSGCVNLIPSASF